MARSTNAGGIIARFYGDELLMEGATVDLMFNRSALSPSAEPDALILAVPVEIIVGIVAEYIRDSMIAAIEDASNNDIIRAAALRR